MGDNDPESNGTSAIIQSNPLDNFDMNELMDMLKTFYRVRRKSSDMVWTEGKGLISIESTNEESELILEEAVKRIHRNWTLQRINNNRRQKLPKFILNTYNISTAELTYIILKDMLIIGSDKGKNGSENIFFIIDDTKYKMNENGIIEPSMDEEADQKKMKEMFRNRY